MRSFGSNRQSSPTGDTSRRAATPRGGARWVLVTTLAATMSAVLLMSSPALAAAPEVVLQDSIDETFTVPAGAFCGVAVTFHDVGTIKLTEFSDADGNVVRMTVHLGGTTTVTSDHGQVVNRWRQFGVLDPAANTITWSGNSYNVHAGAGGILANVSGHWVEGVATGAVTVVGGPHEDPTSDPGALAAVCAELEP